MKKFKAIAILILYLVISLYGQNEANNNIPGTIEDYFPFIEGMEKHFDLLKPSQTGKTKASYSICTANDVIENIQYGAIKTISYVGDIKVVKTEIFICNEEQVSLFESQNEFTGRTRYTNMPIVFKMPKNKEDIMKWKNQENGTDEFSVYEASFLDTLITRISVYENIVSVSEQKYYKGELFGKTINYYAKDFGLVKSELFDEKGVIINMGSSEISKIVK